ncbi:hypothetical protein BamMEX5DRAFT_6209 [Burkholderia ambifaria MEX-5]|uniref:Uncharacterized protein n=1 Tax=Burkholderia ambifaria MEX-5 TaxID=396597 RepID=B1TEJ3_9BURK|nr:hypothetical protein BamMEX5DRAFT_6209 [Burkholderia ambifaria MEX-5]
MPTGCARSRWASHAFSVESFVMSGQIPFNVHMLYRTNQHLCSSPRCRFPFPVAAGHKDSYKNISKVDATRRKAAIAESNLTENSAFRIARLHSISHSHYKA